jgi:two-component system LytT family response regulator
MRTSYHTAKYPTMSEPSDHTRIPISCVKTVEFVLPQEIIRIEGMENYSRVYLKDRKPLLSNNNIGFYKSYLSSMKFISCHKSHIINIDCIIRYHKEGFVEMIGNESVPIARRKKKEFLNAVIMKSFKKTK